MTWDTSTTKAMLVDEGPHAFGIIGPSLPDMRDYTLSTAAVATVTKGRIADPAKLPSKHSLRQWVPGLYHQGNIGACSGCAAAKVVEWNMQRFLGTWVGMSWMYVYHAARTLGRLKGDSGAYSRDIMKAIRYWGVSPEQFHASNSDMLDVYPNAYAVGAGKEFGAVTFWRHKPPLVQSIKQHLFGHIPATICIPVYLSYTSAKPAGSFPYPAPTEQAVGYHMMMVCGYNDEYQITNPTDGSVTTGALECANSWGSYSGQQGFWWVPYRLLDEQGFDCWSMITPKWVDPLAFQ